MSKWLAYTSDWRPVLAEWDRGEYVLPRISLPTFSTHELKSAGAQVRHGQADGDDAVRRAVPDDHLVERPGGEETHGANRCADGFVRPASRIWISLTVLVATGMSTASSRGDVSFGDKDKAEADKKTSGRRSPKRVQVAPAPRDSGDED